MVNLQSQSDTYEKNCYAMRTYKFRQTCYYGWGLVQYTNKTNFFFLNLTLYFYVGIIFGKFKYKGLYEHDMHRLYDEQRKVTEFVFA